MAIEITDEMVAAFRHAFNEEAAKMAASAPDFIEGSQITRAGLAAVVAIVERDRQAQVERAWDDLEQCPSPDPDGTLMCEGELGHDGPHRALRWLRRWP